jgi:hypothetical protein
MWLLKLRRLVHPGRAACFSVTVASATRTRQGKESRREEERGKARGPENGMPTVAAKSCEPTSCRQGQPCSQRRSGDSIGGKPGSSRTAQSRPSNLHQHQENQPGTGLTRRWRAKNWKV